MSGDSQRSDDHDPIDDDFVIEDLGNKGDDLDPLFAPPVAGEPRKPAVASPTASAEPAEEADLLFTDHTQGLQPTQQFEGKGAFAEQGASQWNGDDLELDAVGVPPVEESAEATAAAAMAAAEATFSNELGSLLASEEEFALDSDAELEVVGGETATDGISEFEQSGPFVLDDGEGAWQQDEAAAPAGEAAADAVAGDEQEAAVGDESTVELEAMPALAPVDEEPVEPGWEPLPAANMDALAEVHDVARTDDTVDADAAGELVGVGVESAHESELEAAAFAAPAPLPAPVLVGTHHGGRRRLRVVLALAASLLVCSVAGAMLYEPRWFGVTVEPERLEIVQIERPMVRVDVPTPRVPDQVAAATPVVAPEPSVTTPAPTPEVVPTPTSTPPVAVAEPVSVPTVEPPTVSPAEPLPTPPAEPVVVTTTPAEPVVAPPPAQPVVAEAPTAAAPAEPWPLASSNPSEPKAARGTTLVRVSDNLMLGERDGSAPPRVAPTAATVEGVLPGSRAFAQLRNGNYFIGAVKCANADTVTLRVDNGEVTLATAELARLTELGSADYEDLQKATSGFVRLTNNNRLVGGILSRIADDHIVLEFRSNRVMLPKSAIGEVVHGEGDAAIRLDVTREEDEWLRQIAERQLGTGTPPTLPPPAKPVQPAPTTTPMPDAPAAPAPSPAPPSGQPR